MNASFHDAISAHRLASALSLLLNRYLHHRMISRNLHHTNSHPPIPPHHRRHIIHHSSKPVQLPMPFPCHPLHLPHLLEKHPPRIALRADSARRHFVPRELLFLFTEPVDQIFTAHAPATGFLQGPFCQLGNGRGVWLIRYLSDLCAWCSVIRGYFIGRDKGVLLGWRGGRRGLAVLEGLVLGLCRWLLGGLAYWEEFYGDAEEVEARVLVLGRFGGRHGGGVFCRFVFIEGVGGAEEMGRFSVVMTSGSTRLLLSECVVRLFEYFIPYISSEGLLSLSIRS